MLQTSLDKSLTKEKQAGRKRRPGAIQESLALGLADERKPTSFDATNALCRSCPFGNSPECCTGQSATLC